MTTAAVRTMDQTTRGCTIGIERVLLLDPGLFFEG